MNRAVAEWLEATEDWQIALDDVTDGPGDRVLATLSVKARGKSSGVEAGQHLYTVCAIRDGQIVLMEDYVDESDAREAAGLSGST